MEMHVGKIIEGTRSKSKTECIYFPPSDYFKKLRLQAETNGLELELASQDNDDIVAVDENLYLNSEEAPDVPMNNGSFITFTTLFKYLGTHIHFTLDETYGIDIRINKVTQALGAMRFFFKRREVNQWTKYLIFRAIQINIL